MLKNFHLDKMKVTKNVPLYLLRAPTHHNFTFNSQFLYKLKQNVKVENSVWDFPF